MPNLALSISLIAAALIVLPIAARIFIVRLTKIRERQDARVKIDESLVSIIDSGQELVTVEPPDLTHSTSTTKGRNLANDRTRRLQIRSRIESNRKNRANENENHHFDATKLSNLPAKS